jgi:protein TonB
VVGADGMPVAVEIERSSGSEDLDRAAQNALARWRFTAPPSATSATAVVVAFRLQ